ncbi:HTH-type transcriptional regulator McbR [Pigmentiphaga humi]|uniref:HTH-type transcriptional regulator McbR n=1 Tax=Pigmentiphaga humi TaxID=2478468 RepID=A0A3P4AYC2_9BURK|nr:GntR family transcriptional regulator [Pigmentiphaga humi]VCU68430.1 HTH-type transcriptional regulator McbR [Pigmentiphaga humi]
MATKQDDDNIPAEAPASLRRRAEQDLRRAILSGRYQAGERLKERELMESLGVSRTLLREALRQVEAEGLVELVLNRGPVVARLTYEDAEEIYEVRGILEAQSCVGFALRASSVHMKRLDEVFGQLRQAAEAGDVARTLALSDSFYDVIAEGCGNSVLSVMLKQLHNRIVLLRRTSLSEPGRLPETLDELAHIYRALHARDEEAARKASVHHVRQASRVALRAIRREPR